MVIALVEDQRQEQLLRRYLVRVGFNRHQVRFEMSPSGQGSAERWVRENFARQAGKCRARNARAKTSMFVMLDADAHTVQERVNALDEALISAGQEPINPTHDSIARLITKRNVETWIVWLSASERAMRTVDEAQDYKPTKNSGAWSALIPSASEALWELTRPAAFLPDFLIGSLRNGIQEINRALPVER
ncbi:MAG TPA: hypothetical protein VE291_13450 [Terracidiphilus sp.]|nr:hypothetical protein [Terracidiphilus sp.]